MNSRDMVALQSFAYPYGTRDLKPGDEFSAVSDADAYALTLTGRARLRTPEEPAPRRKYNRRDMTAQT